MNWLTWYDNLVEIVLRFPTHLRLSKSEFGWKNYNKNINYCAADPSPYGSYGNPYDPYAPYPEIRTELATTV
jgi:hypothetical protein